MAEGRVTKGAWEEEEEEEERRLLNGDE